MHAAAPTRVLLPAALFVVVSGGPDRMHAQGRSALPGNVVEVLAAEFFFRAPDTIPAGLTTFELRQTGLIHRRTLAGGVVSDSGGAADGDGTHGYHMLWIVRLDSSRTVSDFYRAALAGAPAAWARNLGGPGFSIPPRTSNATFDLAPGSYVLTCYVGSARADRTRYHVLKGMFKPLVVTRAARAAAAMPAPDIVMRVDGDGALYLSGPITAGRKRVRVENTGARHYEFQVRRVKPGHTTGAALAWRQRNVPGTTAPFEQWGGLSDVPPGGSLLTTMEFTAGDYFIGFSRRVAFTVGAAREARPAAR